MKDLVIKILADWSVFPIILIAIWTLLTKVPNNKKIEAYSRILLAGLTAYFIAKIIGLFYQPSDLRPFELMGVAARASFMNNPGFPSDHVLFVTAITCAVWFETRQKKITLVLAGLTLMVCLGRVLALVHTPLDVIGGLVIALIGSVWYLNNKKD